MLRCRLGHREAALPHEGDRLRVADRPRRGQRRELADGMADDAVRLDPARAHGGEHREARRDERRLLDRRVVELLGIGLEAEANEVEPASLAAAPEDVHRLRHRLRDVAAHPGLERPLARKAERDLVLHAAISFVHSSRADPHVSPAPIPVISTSSPSRSRPSAAASARASGIDPEEVLPYLSTFTTTRSDGIPSFLVAWSMIRTLAWCGM